MYAVIRTSGSQYKIEQGSVLELDRISGAPGDSVTLEDCVLLIDSDGEIKIGNPSIEKASVELEIVDHFRGKKVTVFKMKRRKRYRVKKGHRQELTRVTVKSINVA